MTENNTNYQSNQKLSPLIKIAKGTRFYTLQFTKGEQARLYVLNDGIFRLIINPTGKIEPLKPELTIASDNFDLSYFEKSKLLITDETVTIKSSQYSIRIQRRPTTFSIFDDNLHRYRLMQKQPLEFTNNSSIEFLHQSQSEFYFGGGMQNGHFSHKGKIINIKNTNLTGKGATAVPFGFFWSNAGFGEFRNTWKNGSYNFGKDDTSTTILQHNTPIFDNFYLLGDNPNTIINHYYELTGKPLFLPKYALGLGYLANFADTAWKIAEPQDTSSIKFEDSNSYKIAKDNKDIYAKSSLNGEEKYQFSARAMVERYQKNKLPLSWIVPNFSSDAELLTSSIDNFNSFCNEKNIHLGFYRQLPKTGPNNFLINKASTANTPNDQKLEKIANNITPLIENNKDSRPWASVSNGWSAIQSMSAYLNGGVGGEWNNISAEIASFIGLSLSGQPNIGTSIDGIYGGGNAQVNIRDMQWKVFTPLLFSIDGKGAIQKTPFAFNTKITKINQVYLQLRKSLTPFIYSLLHNAQNGNPLIQALFLAFPKEKINYTEQIRHEFMLGNSILVAPIINGREDNQGKSIKDNLYLPDNQTVWIDPFTGQKLIGGNVYEQLHYPLWHLPVFIRNGSIIQKASRCADIYPHGFSSAILYDDDGISTKSESTGSISTKISSSLSDTKLVVKVHPSIGSFSGLSEQQTTLVNIMTDTYPGNIGLEINKKKADLQECSTFEAFEKADSGYYFNPNYMPYPEFKAFTDQFQFAIQVKFEKANIHSTEFELTIDNYRYADKIKTHAIIDSAMRLPNSATIIARTSRSISISWTNPDIFIENNVKVDIEVNNLIHTNISRSSFTFHKLLPNTNYRFRIRNRVGDKVSLWSEYFGTTTKQDQMDYAIKNVIIKSNSTDNINYPLNNLIDLSLASEWLTDQKTSNDNPLELTFSFDKLYKLSRMVYIPRSRDKVGLILKTQISISTDGSTYGEWSSPYIWPADAKNKVIGLRNVSAKDIKLRILETSDGYVSGKEILFFIAKN